ncbi:MAG: hypothetical protein R3B70_00375 [Polyangiaceae bacterium]
MPLLFDTLKTQLEQTWLVPEGGSFPSSVNESADHFATAVSSWFAAGQAAGFPCTTALPRKGQLLAAATGALSAQSAQAAGAQLAMGVAAYIAGQTFAGPVPGTATFPIGAGAAVSQMIAVFSDTEGSVSQKAQQIATACTLLATTTLVVFPVPPGPPPAPIT